MYDKIHYKYKKKKKKNTVKIKQWKGKKKKIHLESLLIIADHHDFLLQVVMPVGLASDKELIILK